jgi:hypothetical protein
MRCLLFLVLAAVPAFAADDLRPLGPVEARKKVGTEITVKMEVKTAKDRLEKRGEIDEAKHIAVARDWEPRRITLTDRHTSKAENRPK